MSRLAKLTRILRVPGLWIPLLRFGTAAGVEHAEIVRFISPKTLLDVGANKGQFSLVVRKEAPDASIIAFEPLLPAAEKFESIFAQDDSVVLHRVAIGSTTGEFDFFVADRADSSSLLEPGEGQRRAFGVRTSRIIKVPVRPLDTLVDCHSLQHPILLKIDVQGAELDVLKGGQKALESIDFIYAEASFVELYRGQVLLNELASFLSAKGYLMRGVFNQVFTESYGPTQADFLFSRPPSSGTRHRA